MKEKKPRKSQTNMNIIGGLVLIIVPFLLTYLLNLIAYFAAFAIVFVLNTYMGASIEFDEKSFAGGSMPVNTVVMLFLYALLCLIIFGWWYLVIKNNSSNNNESKNITSKKGSLLKNAGLIIVFGYSFQLFIDSILNLVKKVAPKLIQEYDENIGSLLNNKTSVILMLTVIIITPIAEELIFRGVITTYSNKLFPPKTVIIISSVLFAIYHGNIVQGVYAFIAGIILGIIVAKTGKILPAIMLHVVINLSAYLVPDILFKNIITLLFTLVGSASLMFLVIYIIKYGTIWSKQTDATADGSDSKNGNKKTDAADDSSDSKNGSKKSDASSDSSDAKNGSKKSDAAADSNDSKNGNKKTDASSDYNDSKNGSKKTDAADNKTNKNNVSKKNNNINNRNKRKNVNK